MIICSLCSGTLEIFLDSSQRMHSASTDANVGEEPIHAYMGCEVLGINCSKFRFSALKPASQMNASVHLWKSHLFFRPEIFLGGEEEATPTGQGYSG